MSLCFKEITREEGDREQLERFTASRERVVSVAVSALLPDIVGITVENGFVELININSGNFRLFLTYLEGEMVPLETSIRCFSLLPSLEIAAKVGIVGRIKRSRMQAGTVAHPTSYGAWPSVPFPDALASPLNEFASGQGGLNAFFLYSIGYSNQVLIAETSSGEVTILTECESRPSVLNADADYVMCGEGSGKVSVWNLTSILLRYSHSPASREIPQEAPWKHPSRIPTSGGDGGNTMHRRSSRGGDSHSTWLSAALDKAAEAAAEAEDGSTPIWSAFPSARDVLDRPSITGLARCRYQLFCLTSDCHCHILHMDSGMVLGKLVQELAPLVSLLPFPAGEERGIRCWGGREEEEDAAAPWMSMIAAYRDQVVVYRAKDAGYENAVGAAGTVLECRTDSTSFPAGIVPVPPPRERQRVYGYEGACASSTTLSCLTCSEHFIAAGSTSGVIVLYRCSPAFGIIEEIRRFDVWCPVVSIQLFWEAEEVEKNGPFFGLSTPSGMRPSLPKEESMGALLVITASGNVWRWPLKELLLPRSTLFQQNSEETSLDHEGPPQTKEERDRRRRGEGGVDAVGRGTRGHAGRSTAWEEEGGDDHSSSSSSADGAWKEKINQFRSPLLLTEEEEDNDTHEKEGKENPMGKHQEDSPPPSPSFRVPTPTGKDSSEESAKRATAPFPEEEQTIGMRQGQASSNRPSPTDALSAPTDPLIDGKEKREVSTAYTAWKQRLHHQLASPSPHIRPWDASWAGCGAPQEEGGEHAAGGQGASAYTIPGLRQGPRMDPRVIDALLSNAAARNVAEEKHAAHTLHDENASPRTTGPCLPHAPHGRTGEAISIAHSDAAFLTLPPLRIGQPGEWNSTAMHEERAEALRMEGMALGAKAIKNKKEEEEEEERCGVSSRARQRVSPAPQGGGNPCTGSPPPLLVSALAYQFPIPAPHVRLKETLYEDVPQIVEVLVEEKMQQKHPRPYYHLQCRPKNGKVIASDAGQDGCGDMEKWDDHTEEPFTRDHKHHTKAESKKPHGIPAVKGKEVHTVVAGCRSEPETVEEKEDAEEECTKRDRVKRCGSSHRENLDNVDDLQEVTQGLIARKKDPLYEKERQRPPPNILDHHGCDTLLYSFPFSNPGQRSSYPAAFAMGEMRSLSSTAEMVPFSQEGRGVDLFFPSLSSELILFQEYQLQPTEPVFFPVSLPVPGTFPLF